MRKAKRLDQKDLAKKLGVTRSAIGHYERGTRTITPEMFEMWARACGFRVEVIIEEEPAEVLTMISLVRSLPGGIRPAALRFLALLPGVDAETVEIAVGMLERLAERDRRRRNRPA